jgi:hypothetical protein
VARVENLFISKSDKIGPVFTKAIYARIVQMLVRYRLCFPSPTLLTCGAVAD